MRGDATEKSRSQAAGGHEGRQKGRKGGCGSPHLDRDRLGTQLQTMGDCTRQTAAAEMSELHPQTEALLKEVESLIKPSHARHLSCVIGENIVRSPPPEDAVTHRYDTKETDAPALMHVHADVLDSRKLAAS